MAVELGDLCPDGVAPTSGTSTVRLGHDGQVTVSCLSAPPALWSGRAGERLVPELPSCREDDVARAPVTCSSCARPTCWSTSTTACPDLTAVTAAITDPSHRACAVATDIEALTTEGAAVVAVWVPTDLGRRTTIHQQNRPEEVRP